jgi:hypothetical protein
MRHPILLAAAICVAAIPIGVLSCQQQRHVQAVSENLRTMQIEEPPPRASMPAAPPPAEAPMSRVAPPPPPTGSPPPTEEASSAAGATPLPQTLPRIAYVYSYRFRLAADAIAPLQERHLRLCRELGEARCRVVSMQRGESREAGPAAPGGETQAPLQPHAAAALELQVAAPLADRFGQQLSASTSDAHGETVDRGIAAEDVSREMVDTEARIRTRETLIRRLTALLETRSGNIQQAVEAERAINQAQEELDAARAWLAETRGRVAMSSVRILYEAAGAAARDPRNPIATSWDQIGTLTVHSLATLLLFAGVLAPWAAILAFLLFLARWHRRRFGQKDPAPTAETG